MSLKRNAVEDQDETYHIQEKFFKSDIDVIPIGCQNEQKIIDAETITENNLIETKVLSDQPCIYHIVPLPNDKLQDDSLHETNDTEGVHSQIHLDFSAQNGSITNIDLDPEYEDISRHQANRELQREYDGKAITITKIENIVKKQFSREIQNQEAFVEVISEKLLDCKNMLDRLRACIVASYYRNPCSNSMKIQHKQTDAPSIHPSVKKHLGKTVRDVEFVGCSVNNSDIQEHSDVNSIQRDTEKIKTEPENMFVDLSECNEDKDENCKITSGLVQEKIKKRIIVGNVSKYIPVDKREGFGQATHKWMVYVRGPNTNPSITGFVKKVLFFLHPSYRPNDLVEVSESPFHLTRRGWGEFPIRVQLHFKDSSNKKVDIIHLLKLDRTYTGLQTLGSETVVDIQLNNENCMQSSLEASNPSAKNKNLLKEIKAMNKNNRSQDEIPLENEFNNNVPIEIAPVLSESEQDNIKDIKMKNSHTLCNNSNDISERNYESSFDDCLDIKSHILLTENTLDTNKIKVEPLDEECLRIKTEIMSPQHSDFINDSNVTTIASPYHRLDDYFESSHNDSKDAVSSNQILSKPVKIEPSDESFQTMKCDNIKTEPRSIILSPTNVIKQESPSPNYTIAHSLVSSMSAPQVNPNINYSPKETANIESPLPSNSSVVNKIKSTQSFIRYVDPNGKVYLISKPLKSSQNLVDSKTISSNSQTHRPNTILIKSGQTIKQQITQPTDYMKKGAVSLLTGAKYPPKPDASNNVTTPQSLSKSPKIVIVQNKQVKDANPVFSIHPSKSHDSNQLHIKKLSIPVIDNTTTYKHISGFSTENENDSNEVIDKNLNLKSDDFNCVEELVMAVVKKCPLIFPESSFTLKMNFSQLTEYYVKCHVAKRRAIEWLRARDIRKQILSILNEKIHFKGEKVWTTKAIMIWCRRNCFTPLDKESTHKFHTEQKPSSLNADMLNSYSEGKRFIEEAEMFASTVDYSCYIDEDLTELDVLSIDSKRDVKKEVMSPNKIKTENKYFSSMPREVEFIHNITSKIGLQIQPQMINTEELGTIDAHISEEIIFSAMKQFMNSLLRASFSAIMKEKRQPEEVTAIDIYNGALARENFDFLTNQYLGIICDVEN